MSNNRIKNLAVNRRTDVVTLTIHCTSMGAAETLFSDLANRMTETGGGEKLRGALEWMAAPGTGAELITQHAGAGFVFVAGGKTVPGGSQ